MRKTINSKVLVSTLRFIEEETIANNSIRSDDLHTMFNVGKNAGKLEEAKHLIERLLDLGIMWKQED